MILVLVLYILRSGLLLGQTSSVVIPSNISTGSLEKNLLFFANERYQVSSQGPDISLGTLFDGRFQPATTATAPSLAAPLVILIENLPLYHSQQGAWIGWSSRVYVPTNFKIEGYNTYGGANQWITIADISGHSEKHYMKKIPSGAFGKLRFTFYAASGTNGLMQLSELFYIHPEATQAYDGMMVKYNGAGNVGIGTNTPQAKLSVNGNILAKEVKVKSDISVPDYVFDPEYSLLSLSEIETYVKQYRQLPEIPSATDIEHDGLDLAEMNLLLLKKVEELTLHLIEKEKKEQQMYQLMNLMETRLNKLENTR